MQHKIFRGMLAAGVIVVGLSFFRPRPMGRPGSEKSVAPEPAAGLEQGEGAHSSQPGDVDPASEAPETTDPGRRGSVGDQRVALERAVAVQEKFVEEKRAALLQWIMAKAINTKSDGISTTSRDSPVPKIPESARDHINESNAYQNLKRDYEVEQQNLERMKNKLEEP